MAKREQAKRTGSPRALLIRDHERLDARFIKVPSQAASRPSGEAGPLRKWAKATAAVGWPK